MSTREDREIDAQADRVWDSQHPVDLVCPSCGGDGQRQANYGSVAWDEPLWIRCDDCDGTGVIDPDAFEDPYEWRQADYL